MKPAKQYLFCRIDQQMALISIVLLLFGTSFLPHPLARGEEATAATSEEKASLSDDPFNPIVMLIRDPTVQADLQLDRQQIDNIERLVAVVDNPLWKLRDIPKSEEMKKKRASELQNIFRFIEEKLASILQPQQVKRLDEMVLRAQGWSGLLMPKTRDHLKLTTHQTEGIRKILTETNQHLTTLGAKSQKPLDRKQLEEQVKQVQAERTKKILALFSESQKQSLTRLVGKPYDLSKMRRRATVAPELLDVTEWIHSKPLTLAQLRGNVVVLHFYTSGCINCVRNLPWYQQWYTKFSGQQFRMIGIHRPESPGERDIKWIREKAKKLGIEYPIAVDNDSANWNAWGNCIWPSVYLIDKKGYVRYWWYGELNWEEAGGQKFMQQKIEALLAESNS